MKTISLLAFLGASLFGTLNCSIDQPLQGVLWSINETKAVSGGQLRTHTYPETEYQKCLANGGTAVTCDACKPTSCPDDTITSYTLSFLDSKTRSLITITQTCYKTSACQESASTASYTSHAVGETKYLNASFPQIGTVTASMKMEGDKVTLTNVEVTDINTGAKVDETLVMTKKVS